MDKKAKKMKKAKKKPIDIFKPAATTGDLVRAFRTKFDIRQDDMAHACKISQANLSAIEKNRREVGPRIALRLAAYMGLSPDIILYPTGYETEPEYKETRSRSGFIVPMAAKGR